MATNSDAARGFRPVDNIFGGEYTGRTREVAFVATDATAAFNGSLVVYTGASINNGTIPVVTLATGASSEAQLAGAVVRFAPEVDGDWTNYHRLASTLKRAFIPSDPKCLYQVQEDSVGGNIDTSTDIGFNIDFTAEVGDAQTGYSTMELDSSSAAALATLPIRLQNIVDREDVDGDSTESNATWIVSINLSAELDTLGTT